MLDWVDFDDQPPAGKQREPRLVSLGNGAGRLGLWARPGLARLSAWKAKGLTAVLTLLSEREGARDIENQVRAAGLEWFWFSLDNGKNLSPERQADLLAFLPALNELLDRGGWMIIHCAAGQHRTGMVGYALLRSRGLDAASALAMIEQMRPLTFSGVGTNRLGWVENWFKSAGPVVSDEGQE